jgi:nickel superoxide dismutase
MNTRKVIVAALCLALLASAGLSLRQSVSAHCQVPCGIYGDDTRFDLLKEHVTTIEKSRAQIVALSADAANNTNQLARWVNNKDKHADELANIITYYFLQQRVKPLAEDASAVDKAAYLEKLTLCHEILVSAMKCKQSTDAKNPAKLGKLVEAFHQAYAH